MTAPGPNFRNRTLFHGDNLPVLRGMNSGCVDLIATDPPFNKGKGLPRDAGLACGWREVSGPLVLGKGRSRGLDRQDHGRLPQADGSHRERPLRAF